MRALENEQTRRRMLGYTPRFESSLGLWVCADNVVASGSLVSQLADMSGYGRNFSQSSDAKKPTRIANARNGHAVIDFNGTSQYLTTGAVSFPAPMHLFFAVKLRPNNNANPHRLIDQTVAGSPTALIYTDATSIYLNDGNVAPTLTGLTPSTWMILDVVRNSTASKIAKNGGEQTVGNSGTNSMNGILLGAYANLGDYFGNFQLGELIVFSAEKTGTARSRVCAYLSSKWGIPLS